MEAATHLIGFFFKLQTQIRLYHWQTKSYARHQATNGLLLKLDPLVDQFLEVYQGKYGKVNIGHSRLGFEIRALSDDEASQFLDACVDTLGALEDKGFVSEDDTDLLNIRDEILSNLHQTKYLFSFH